MYIYHINKFDVLALLIIFLTRGITTPAPTKQLSPNKDLPIFLYGQFETALGAKFSDCQLLFVMQ